ncbi:MAG: PqqD family protein [Gemmatimonadales bacterium]
MKLPKPKASVIFKELSEGALLFSTEDEVYLGLNTVGSRIWRLLPPTCETLDQLVSKMASEYTEVTPEVIRRDVLELLADLEDHNLVDPFPSPLGPREG